MNMQRKGLSVFVILLIFSFFSVSTAYLHICAETDLPSSKLKIENFDQDLPWDDKQDNSAIVTKGYYGILKTHRFETSHRFSYQEFSLNQKTVTLRC
jgi:hypothetical protein